MTIKVGHQFACEGHLLVEFGHVRSKRDALVIKVFADIARISHVALVVSNWELNKGFPDISNLIMLSDLFDITLDSLIKEDADMKEQLLQDKSSKNINLIFSTIALTVCLVIFGYAMHNVITSHFNELHVMGLTVGILGTFSFGFELKKYLGK